MRTTLNLSRRARTAVAAVTAVVALAACGGGDEATVSSGGGEPSSSVSASPVPGIDAEHNDQDIAFITDMKIHHEGALEMAELAATRAEDPRVKDLAERIVAAQDPEIQTMQQMASAWGVDLDAGADGAGPHGGMEMGGEGEMDMGEDTEDMGMAEDMAALEELSGAEFDEAFLNSMTVHHSSAVEMAEVQLAEGLNPQAKEMAQDIVTSQTAEIAEMKTLLAEL